MNTDLVREVCATGVAAARAVGAEGVEVFAVARRTREVAFEKNDLNLARADEELTVGVRVLSGQSFGFVTVNAPGRVEEAVRQALAVAKIAPPDAHHHLPEPVALARPRYDWDPGLSEFGLGPMAELASHLADRIKARDARLSIDGIRVSAEEAAVAIASSTGIEASHVTSDLSGFVMGMAIDGSEVGSFNYDGASGNRLATVRAELLSAMDRFAEKALWALGARKGETFMGRVLLTPDAVGEILLEPLLGALGADNLRKGRSPLQGRLGARVAASCVSLRDPGRLLDGMAIAPFDREGQAIEPLSLVRDGILEGFFYDAYEARRAGCGSTGHGRGGAKGPPVLMPGLIEMAGGDEAAAALEARAGRALVVPRFAGRVEMATGEFSGVVKGGFLVGSGDRVPVEETMISGNLYDVLQAIEAVSSDRQNIFGSALLPWVLADGVQVTAG